MTFVDNVEQAKALAHKELASGRLGANLTLLGVSDWEREVRACLEKISTDLELDSLDRSGMMQGGRFGNLVIHWHHRAGGNANSVPQQTTITVGITAS